MSFWIATDASLGRPRVASQMMTSTTRRATPYSSLLSATISTIVASFVRFNSGSTTATALRASVILFQAIRMRSRRRAFRAGPTALAGCLAIHWFFRRLLGCCLGGMGIADVLLPPAINHSFANRIGVLTTLYMVL